MQIKYKIHIMDEINEQIATASKSKKRIDIISLDEHEWTEFKTYMRTKRDGSTNDVSNTTESFRINGIIIKPETIAVGDRIK